MAQFCIISLTPQVILFDCFRCNFVIVQNSYPFQFTPLTFKRQSFYQRIESWSKVSKKEAHLGSRYIYTCCSYLYHVLTDPPPSISGQKTTDLVSVQESAPSSSTWQASRAQLLLQQPVSWLIKVSGFCSWLSPIHPAVEWRIIH